MNNNKIGTTLLICLLCLSMFAVALPQVYAVKPPHVGKPEEPGKPTPEISVTVIADPTSVAVGGTVSYTYSVTGGILPLFDVVVTDDVAGDATYQSGDTKPNNILDWGETWIFTADYTVSETDSNPLENTATASGYFKKEPTTDVETCSVEVTGTVEVNLPDTLSISGWEYFGNSVAVGEGLIVVGAPYYDNSVGKVYVYSANDGTLVDEIFSLNPISQGHFGASVTIGDGIIVVGAPDETSGGIDGAGNVYIYDILNLETAPDTLTSENPEQSGYFGFSVAVGEGLIVVGAMGETSGTLSFVGNAYVYDVSGLALDTILTSDNPVQDGVFGYSVAIGPGFILVGAPGEKTVYIFQ